MDKYIIFKLGQKEIAIKENNEYNLEPTLINKITTDKELEDPLTGHIIYKNKKIKVFDISYFVNEPKLKKFDGLIFISYNNKEYAIQYEGFYKITNNLNNDLELKIDELNQDLLRYL